MVTVFIFHRPSLRLYFHFSRHFPPLSSADTCLKAKKKKKCSDVNCMLAQMWVFIPLRLILFFFKTDG